MPRFVYRPNHPFCDDNGMVEASMAGPKHISSSAPGVISDTMDSTRHMADGLYYDSKSEFRKATKAAGCQEVGNETATLMKPRQRIELSREQCRNEIRKAISQLR